MCKENLGCLLTEMCVNEQEIREDERRKFAEWLSDCGYLGIEEYDGFEPLVVNEVLAEYEDEIRRENDKTV